MFKNETIKNIKVKIEDYINNLAEQQNVSGSVLVSIKGEKIINKSYGMANYELDVPNTVDTKFRIGSLTKQFTAVAVMQLVEKGVLALDDSLEKFISDYPNGSNVTIHHLLTHSSGILNHTSDAEIRANMIKHHEVEELIEEFKYKPYDFEPGAKFSYSNSGYVLLGYIIEKITGKSYEEYINENIFNKLSMNNSGYDNHISLIKNRARGYDVKEGKIVNCQFIDMSAPYAGGALFSTTGDLYKWNNALIGEKLISKEYLSKMTGNQIKGEENWYYGYGMQVRNTKIGGKVKRELFHFGAIPGFLSFNSIYPDDEVQIIVLTNVTNNSRLEIVDNVKDIIFREEIV